MLDIAETDKVQFIKVADRSELELNRIINDLALQGFALFFTTETLIGMIRLSDAEEVPAGTTIQ